jgi:hypothetical protein
MRGAQLVGASLYGESMIANMWEVKQRLSKTVRDVGDMGEWEVDEGDVVN